MGACTVSRGPVALHAPGERWLVRRLKLRAELNVRARPVESRYTQPGTVLVAGTEADPPRYFIAADPPDGLDVFLYARHAHVCDLLVSAQVLDPRRIVDAVVAL